MKKHQNNLSMITVVEPPTSDVAQMMDGPLKLTLKDLTVVSDPLLSTDVGMMKMVMVVVLTKKPLKLMLMEQTVDVNTLHTNVVLTEKPQKLIKEDPTVDVVILKEDVAQIK
jgi:hypothetical protein